MQIITGGYSEKKKIIISLLLALFITMPCSAISRCAEDSLKDYPNISITQSSEYPVRCMQTKIDGELVTIYGNSSASCASAGAYVADSANCDEETTDASTKTTPITDGKIDNTEKDEHTTTKRIIWENTTTELNIGFLISLIANGVLLVVVMILVILLAKKKQSTASPVTPVTPVAPITPTDPNPTMPTPPTQQ